MLRFSGMDLAKVSRGIVGLDERGVLAVSDSAMVLKSSARIKKIEREILRRAPLELSRLPHTQLFPHDERNIEGRRMHQQPFQNVVAPSQMKPPHATGFVQVSKTS